MDRIMLFKLKTTIKLIFLMFFATWSFVTSAEDRDIGLRLRDDGTTVSIASCSNECPGSEMKIRKNLTSKGIKLVDPGDSTATDIRVKVASGIKAMKRYTPITGGFRNVGGDAPVTWISSITCRCLDGSTKRFGSTGHPGVYDSNVIWEDVNKAISNKKLGITPPGSNSDNYCMIRRTMNGVPDTKTLNAVCQILGYDSYVSSTCPDAERSWKYPMGKCFWDSPPDNCWSYFE